MKPLIWNLKSSSPLMMPYLCALSARRARNWYSNMLRRQIRHCTEVRSNSFSSGQVITVVVVIPTDRKLLNITCVHWAKPEQVKHAENETKPVLRTPYYYQTKVLWLKFDKMSFSFLNVLHKDTFWDTLVRLRWLLHKCIWLLQLLDICSYESLLLNSISINSS